jgi:hypothetical protein
MATLLVFHLLGLYPGALLSRHSQNSNLTISIVPSSSQYLILSPFVPEYTIHNPYLNVSTTVTVLNYDPATIRRKVPKGAAAYVNSVTVNGVKTASRCHFDFYDTFRVGGNITIELTSDKASVDSCDGTVPESLSTGMYFLLPVSALLTI